MRRSPKAAPEAQALGLLGLAARAGAAVPGTDRVRDAARRGELEFVLLAADASENSRKKLLPLLDRLQIPHETRCERVELGTALGRSSLSAVGLTDASLAARLRTLLRGAAGS